MHVHYTHIMGHRKTRLDGVSSFSVAAFFPPADRVPQIRTVERETRVSHAEAAPGTKIIAGRRSKHGKPFRKGDSNDVCVISSVGPAPKLSRNGRRTPVTGRQWRVFVGHRPIGIITSQPPYSCFRDASRKRFFFFFLLSRLNRYKTPPGDPMAKRSSITTRDVRSV